MVGHRSVYPSQVLATAKTKGVRVRRGAEPRGEGEVEVRPVRFRRLRVIARLLATLYLRLTRGRTRGR